MTHPPEDSAIRAAMESLIENGLDGMGEAIRILMNEAMKIERTDFLQAIRDIFNAPDQQEAERMLDRLVDRYQQTAPKLTEWAQENIPQGLIVFGLPQIHWVRLRTTNGLERLNREIKRRTRVASIFPNEASLLRLASALLVEIDDEWQTGKIYLNMKSEKIQIPFYRKTVALSL